jgi:hypothetical protein
VGALVLRPWLPQLCLASLWVVVGHSPVSPPPPPSLPLQRWEAFNDKSPTPENLRQLYNSEEDFAMADAVYYESKGKAVSPPIVGVSTRPHIPVLHVCMHPCHALRTTSDFHEISVLAVCMRTCVPVPVRRVGVSLGPLRLVLLRRGVHAQLGGP